MLSEKLSSANLRALADLVVGAAARVLHASALARRY
jgi:hypothetical protein